MGHSYTAEECETILKKKKVEIEEWLEEHLKYNDAMRELFEKHPERKELYVLKVLDSGPLW